MQVFVAKEENTLLIEGELLPLDKEGKALFGKRRRG